MDASEAKAAVGAEYEDDSDGLPTSMWVRSREFQCLEVEML